MSADSDSFQDSIASKLEEDERTIHNARFLLVIGNDASNEVGSAHVQLVNQAVELVLEKVPVLYLDLLQSPTYFLHECHLGFKTRFL